MGCGLCVVWMGTREVGDDPFASCYRVSCFRQTSKPSNPTTGGVTASYAMLGDVHIAEPGALICFAGPRVIEQTIREKLPKGFQRSEYLYDHGMVDMVVHRHNLRSTIGSLAAILTKQEAPSEFAAMVPAAAGGVSMRDVVVAAESDDDLAVAPPAVHAE